MSYVQIPNLPAVASVSGQELFEGVQSGTSVKISLDQIVAASRAGTPTTIPLSVSVGGTGASTLTGYVIGSGTAPFTASTTIPNTDITGLGTMSVQNANAVAITGGSVTGITDLAVADGGTGQGAALTPYGLIYGGSTTAMASTAAGTSVQVLHGNASGAPTWGSVSLTADVSGVLPVARGGTNISSYTIGDIIYASTAGVLSSLADVATGNAIISGGVGAAPSYGKIGLTTHVSGTLGVGNGGTGQASNLTQYGVVYGTSTTAMATSAAGTSSQVLHGNASGAPTFGAVALATEVSGTLGVTNGGTGQQTALTQGGVIYSSSTTAMATTAAGTTGQALVSAGTSAPAFGTLPVTGGGTGVTTSTGSGSVVLGTGPTITSGVYSGTVGASSPSTGAFTTVTASTSVLSSGTGGIGYSTGAGVAVTQLTSRTTAAPTTGVSKSGAVTLFTATAVVGTYFSFTVPNTGIAVTDTVVLSVRGATNTYVAFCSAITAATSFQVTMASVAGVSSDTPIVNFTIIKGVSA